MNLFQWLAVPALAALCLVELVASVRGRTRYRTGLLRALVWLAGAIAIARPSIVQDVADQVGIGTGANLVLYLVALAFLATTFYFYSRYVRLQQQITKLVRHLAIQDAVRGDTPPLVSEREPS